MRNIILIITTLILASSCNPNKRIQRIARNNGISLIKIDTLRDTVVIAKVTHDTVIKYSELEVHDTITIEKDRLTVRVIKKHDSIYIEGECAEIIKEVKIPCETETIIVNPLKHYRRAITLFLLIILLAFVIYKKVLR